MSNTVVTSVGTSFVTSAHTNGALIAITHFLPIYDYRIDPQVASPVISAISAVAEETAGLTQPFGEAIWNQGNLYTISSTDGSRYIISGIGETTATGQVLGSPQIEGPVDTNHYNGVTLSDQYAGQTITQSGTGNYVFSPSLLTSAGSNLSDYADTTKMYAVNDYTPVRESGYDYLKGKFNCRIIGDLGTFKFNKIALFARQYVNGVQTGDPGFFGEAYIETPQKKSFFGDGANEFDFDIQLTLSASGGLTPESVFYGTSADYWSKVPNGLYSSEKVSVGVFESDNNEPQATMHIGRVFSGTSARYADIPQLRMEDENETGIDHTVSGGATTGIEWADIMLEYTSLTKETASSISLNFVPQSSATNVNYGDLTRPINRLTFRGEAEISGDYSSYNLLRTKDLYLKLDRSRLYFYDGNETANTYQSPVSATYHNVVYGADIVRNDNDLVVQTRFKNIYILAGGSNQAKPTDNMASRHTNNIADVNGITELSSTNWVNSATANIVARGGFRVFGPLEINYVPRDSAVYSNISDWGVIAAKRKYTAIIAGLKLNTTDGFTNFEQQYDWMLEQNITNAIWNPIINNNYIQSASELYIQAGTIKIWGNIIPGFYTDPGDNYQNFRGFNLGSNEYKFREIHSEKIFIDSYDPELSAGSTYNTNDNRFFGLNIARYKTRGENGETHIIPYGLDEEVYIGRNFYRISEIWVTDLYVGNIHDVSDITSDDINATNADITNITASNVTVRGGLTVSGDIYAYDDIISLDDNDQSHELKWYTYVVTASVPATQNIAVPFDNIKSYTAIANGNSSVISNITLGAADTNYWINVAMPNFSPGGIGWGSYEDYKVYLIRNTNTNTQLSNGEDSTDIVIGSQLRTSGVKLKVIVYYD